MFTRLFGLILAAGLAVSASDAAVYTGNPVLSFHVQDSAGLLTGGDADLERIEIHHCGGGRTRTDINEPIDPVEGYSLDIDPGSHCGVSIVWDGVVELSGSGFTLEYDRVVTWLPLTGATQSADFSPFTVVSGSYGEVPVVTVDVQ